MARIFSFFLIILVMNNQVMSLDIFGIDFGTIKQAYNYMNLVYTKGYEYANRDIIKRNSPEQQLKNMMIEIRTISKRLENFENHIDESLNGLRNFLLNNIGNMIDFYDAKSELLKHIESVNLLFKRGMALEENGNYNNNTLRTFLHQVLYDRYNLEYSLFEIYKLILPGMNTIIRKGFITLANDYATKNYERLCNKGSSSQQHMFYVFELLIRTHLRGFTTLTQAHSMRTIFDSSNYIQEYENIKKRSHEQLTNYTKVFMHELNNLRADIRSCDVKNPIIGKNVYEMVGLFRVIVNTEEKIKAAVYYQTTPVCGNCEEIRNSYGKYRFYNCKSYVSVEGCPESEMNLNGKSVRYKWFTADSKTFGHRGKCDYALYDLNDHYGAYWCKNDICACSINITRSDYMPSESRSFYFYPNFAPYIVDTDLHIDAPKIMKISVEPQYSDIENNMVVMGVRFMLHDNAIHLQIQQRKISESSAVIKEAVWKRVDVDGENKPINISHDNVYYDRSSIYLDDVMVHPDFLVTGVKLHPTKNDDGFELHVHATQFNAKTGLLRGSQRWFKPGEYTPDQQDYKRNRTKITINDPDNPILRNDYYPDPETNKFIQFQHTSVVKDAGYHTVPFFDGQSVQSPQFPLGGVGLFYRHQNGFGGYIAPRLLTYNITWNIESSFNAWRNIEKAYEKCGLEVPPNPIEVDENTTCETLSQMVINPIQD